jgi:short-subunit dehydrogenase
VNCVKPVVWITGASSGIGKALVGVFYKQGYNVILSSRNNDALHRTASEFGIPDSNYAVLAFDLQNASSKADSLAATACSFFGKVDVLILNGGVSQRMDVFQTDDSTLRKMMEINFFSGVSLAKSMLPHFQQRKTGQVIVISSIAGKFGFYLRPAYCASKHALHGYFDTFRLETEKFGVRTLIVCPGKIKTAISENAITQEGKHGVMEESHEKAMSADVCAEKIYKAMIKNKEEVWIGGKEILMVYFKNFFPLLFRIIIRKIKHD